MASHTGTILQYSLVLLSSLLSTPRRHDLHHAPRGGVRAGHLPGAPPAAAAGAGEGGRRDPRLGRGWRGGPAPALDIQQGGAPHAAGDQGKS